MAKYFLNCVYKNCAFIALKIMQIINIVLTNYILL